MHPDKISKSWEMGFMKEARKDSRLKSKSNEMEKECTDYDKNFRTCQEYFVPTALRDLILNEYNAKWAKISAMKNVLKKDGLGGVQQVRLF